MTEKKGRRRHWRRGPRRKKDEGALPAAGDVTAAGEAGERPDAAGGAEPAVDAIPAGSAGPETPEDGGSTREDEGSTGREGAGGAEPGTAPKKGRRRSRRRGGRHRGGESAAAAGSEVPEGAGAAVAEAPPGGEEPLPEASPSEVSEVPADVTSELPAGAADIREAVRREENALVEEGVSILAEAAGSSGKPQAPPEESGKHDEFRPEGGGAASAPPEASGQTPKKGRRRRRRRHRGGNGQNGQGAAPPETGQPSGAEAPEAAGEDAGTAGGREAFEEEFPEPRGPEGGEEAEEELEPGEEEQAGQGPRRVMLIDGMQPEEVRVAFVSDGALDYFEAENQRKKQFKGNIYKGKVVNIAQGIEAAFVEFGGGRHGFLPLNEYCGGALIESLGHWNGSEKRPHLRPGMEILVQVTKEESSIKGAALTSYISIAGRYLVMMLGMKRYGVSKKITAEKERERIRKNMEKLDYPEHLGFIVRTAGAGRGPKDLKADLQNLLKMWDRTVDKARALKAPALLYEEQDIVIRTLRDHYTADVAQVLMDSPDSFRKATDFFDVYYPKQKSKLVLYRQKRPLFSKFNLEDQLDRATARKVPLPSGGHIVIDKSEAMWTIDVNSGRGTRDRDIEDTAYRTNKEAAVEVARQLRLRDMGGLIVVDFIDMESRGHNKEVERTLKETMKRDKAKSDVSSLGKFGLLAISRQRMGISFYDVLMKPCDHCEGTGIIPTGDAIIVKILRRIHDELSRDQGKHIVVRVSPLLLEKIFNQKRDEISRLETMCGARVSLLADASLPAVSFTVGAAPA